MLLVINILPELVLQLADRGIIATPWLRTAVYALGAFQPDLMIKHGAFFFGQSLTMFFTYGVLHTGMTHLVINMIGLAWLGRWVLQYRSSETFLTFYLLATVGAAEAFALIGPGAGMMVGASGALFGLMGLYLADSGLLTPRTDAWHSLMGRIIGATAALILSDIASSALLGNPVAWQAHAGGFLTGAALGLIYPPRQPRRA
ncbi:rhomboid family intramembrane serine protease [Pseudorhodobacter turbinis]|nr:rhomboid family intramembrane serine protease [Pseudorhodobacter turbinis]